MTEEQEYYNIVSFSLTEKNKDKELGAIENAKKVSELFPGWRGHFFVHPDIDDEVKDAIAQQANCFVYLIEEDSEAAKEVWSFLPLGQVNSVSAFISRECDSMICERDAQAVNAWMQSPTQFHTIRDHEQDRSLPVNSKLFGAKLHGPINTIWLLHFLHNHNKDGVIDVSELLNRFYNGFNFLFMEHDYEEKNS